MARGRQQKWVCLDCKQEFSVQGNKPKLCCSCGSENIGRAPSYDLAIGFSQKREELDRLIPELNESYRRFTEAKERYDVIMSYWAQQKRRGYITQDEYDMYASLFEGAANKKGENDESCN